LLRNPIDRAFSHWNMQRDRKLDSLDFLDAVKEEENRAREVYPFQLRKFSYIERGFYSEQMERVFKFFPREHVLVIKFDDLAGTIGPSPIESLTFWVSLLPLGSKIVKKMLSITPGQ
jgi:hypothetical protein